jgi:hypothetical protein
MTQLAQGRQISFDDAGGNDLDFQDFTVSAELGPETMTQQPQGRQIPFDDRPGNDMEFHHSTASGELAPLLVPETVTVLGTILGDRGFGCGSQEKKARAATRKMTLNQPHTNLNSESVQWYSEK